MAVIPQDKKNKFFFFVSGINSDLTLGFQYHSNIQYLNSILQKKKKKQPAMILFSARS